MAAKRARQSVSSGPPSAAADTASSSTSPSSPSSSIVGPPLPSSIDPNLSPFTLSSSSHNLLLTLLTQSHHTPHPWIKCHRCGKWRKLPPTLAGLSPLLPALPLTLSSLSSLSSPFLPFPFTCMANHWDLDRQVCGAIQDYQDLVYEWRQVPLRFVRAVPRMDFFIALAHFLRVKGVAIAEYPCVYGKSIDLFALYSLVYQAGGDDAVTAKRQWLHVYHALKLPTAPYPDVDYLAEIYRSYFFEWQAPAKIDFALMGGAGAEGEAEAEAGKEDGEEAGEQAGQGEEDSGEGHSERNGNKEGAEGEVETESRKRIKTEVENAGATIAAPPPEEKETEAPAKSNGAAEETS